MQIKDVPAFTVTWTPDSQVPTSYPRLSEHNIQDQRKVVKATALIYAAMCVTARRIWTWHFLSLYLCFVLLAWQ